LEGRKWRLTDASELAINLSNKKVQDNLRDGLPYPYTDKDAEPFSYNTASCRVLEKAGFQYEGLLRKNAFKNGKIVDMKMYALIR
jgi:RimJ/RimL family protein N-acetyltransferase